MLFAAERATVSVTPGTVSRLQGTSAILRCTVQSMPLVDYDSQQQQVVMAKELVQVMKMERVKLMEVMEKEKMKERVTERVTERMTERMTERVMERMVKVKVLLESQKMKETL